MHLHRQSRGDLERAATAALELRARRKAAPLAYARLWDRPLPRTSQRRALAEDFTSGPDGKRPRRTLLPGGNRTGKSQAMAWWALAMAGGIDAVVMSGHTEIQWVRAFAARNGLSEGQFPAGPAPVWVGSPAFGIAREQIRPKLQRYAPVGSRFVAWDQISEAEMHLPGPKDGHGWLASKAYKQWEKDHQTWEGAAIRALAMDEQPTYEDNMLAGFSRLIDYAGRGMMALTPLRGKADWVYRKLVHPHPEWFRRVRLRGRDNPHVPQEERERIVGTGAAWLRPARDDGDFVSPEGAIYAFDRDQHLYTTILVLEESGLWVPHATPPAHWIRWQGIDWGTRHPHVLWAAEDPRNSDLYVYRELAPRRSTTEPGISTDRLLDMVLDAERGTPEGGVGICLRVADSADPDAIIQAGGRGLNVAPSEKERGSVAKGIEVLEALLRLEDPVTREACRPRVRIHRTACPVLVEELEGLRWGPEVAGQDPRPDPECPDHGPDALRYLVRYRQQQGFV